MAATIIGRMSPTEVKKIHDDRVAFEKREEKRRNALRRKRAVMLDNHQFIGAFLIAGIVDERGVRNA